MATIGIIGGGAFGTAMACVVRRSGHRVRLWALERDVADAINARHENPHFLPGVALDPEISATNDLATAARGADFVISAVPAQHVREVAGALRPALRPGMPVVSCSKGIERGSCALMPEVLRDMLPAATVAVLSGPSFAKEIAIGQPCGVVLACHDWFAGEDLAAAISNPDFCVQLSADVVGTALAGAMKNVISIASGIAYQMTLGENARATIITLGLFEASRLALAKGGQAETFAGLAGAGDFMLTAHSLQSRNTTLGVELAKGRTAAEVLGERREVTEGAFSVTAAAALARQLRVDMPITEALDAIINGGIGVEAAIARLRRHLPPLFHAGARKPEEVT
ncbi:MAG: NAD(P)H-dependent glycerol-3-phosphate dehydrogenase [Betaproteobacteria bacterium]